MELRLVNEADVVTVEDDSGNYIKMLKHISGAQLEVRDEVLSDEAIKLANKFMGGIEEARKQAKSEEKKDEVEFSTPKIRKVMFEIVAVEMKISDKVYKGKELSNIYGKLLVESQRWIDEKVKEIWDSNVPSEKEKK